MKYFVGQKVIAIFGGTANGSASDAIVLDEVPGDEFRFNKYRVGAPYRGKPDDWSDLQEFVMFEDELTTYEEMFHAQVRSR